MHSTGTSAKVAKQFDRFTSIIFSPFAALGIIIVFKTQQYTSYETDLLVTINTNQDSEKTNLPYRDNVSGSSRYPSTKSETHRPNEY